MPDSVVKSEFSDMIDQIIYEEIAIIDEVIKEEIIPLIEMLGSPEKVIGKPYEEWTVEDHKRATAIYTNISSEDIQDKALNWLVKKEMDRVEQKRQILMELEGR